MDSKARIAELEAEVERLKELNRRINALDNDKADQLVDLKHRAERLARALRDLEQAEANYRRKHDQFGAYHIEVGRAWDKLRHAGDKARAALSDAPAEPKVITADDLLAFFKARPGASWVATINDIVEAMRTLSDAPAEGGGVSPISRRSEPSDDERER